MTLPVGRRFFGIPQRNAGFGYQYCYCWEVSWSKVTKQGHKKQYRKSKLPFFVESGWISRRKQILTIKSVVNLSSVLAYLYTFQGKVQLARWAVFSHFLFYIRFKTFHTEFTSIVEVLLNIVQKISSWISLNYLLFSLIY